MKEILQSGGWVTAGAYPVESPVTVSHDFCILLLLMLQEAISPHSCGLFSILSAMFMISAVVEAMLCLFFLTPYLLTQLAVQVTKGRSSTLWITCMQLDSQGMLLTLEFYSAAPMAVLRALT